MRKKIYFAGSITGGREDAALYQTIIRYLKRSNDVLTEHVGDPGLSEIGQTEFSPEQIYTQDTSWLRMSDLVIAECSRPSLGVGYELAYAEKLGIPCHILHRPSCGRLSSMLTGDPYFQIHSYEGEEDLFAELDGILENEP